MADSFTKTIGVQDLLDAGLHFGHQTKRWNPKMKRYIHGAKNGIYIIDLNKTLSQLELAKTFLNDVVLRGVTLGTTHQTRTLDKRSNTRGGRTSAEPDVSGSPAAPPVQAPPRGRPNSC